MPGLGLASLWEGARGPGNRDRATAEPGVRARSPPHPNFLMGANGMSYWKSVLGGVLLLGVLGCGGGESGSTQQPAATTPETAPAIDSTALTVTPTGLRYEDLVVGSGAEANPGDTVTVEYTGWLLNGPKFDSSIDRGETFSFALGGGHVILGWEEGVAGMKVGGRRRLVIPPDLAYGAAGRPPSIPPNSTLVFDVELLGVGG